VLENYYGLIELVLTLMLVIGLCLWQLRDVEKAKKKLAEEQARRDKEA
jgi:hypothetical protein